MITKLFLEEERGFGKSLKQIAAEIGMPHSTLTKRAKQLGVKFVNNCNCKELIGQRFGKLTVIERGDKKKGYTSAIWRCQCDCGNIKEVSAYSLTKNICQSCGCKHAEVHWTGHGEISGNCWYCIKKSAEARKIEFDVSIEYAWNLFLEQERSCALTGWELCFVRSTKNNERPTASLDRIDSSIGYTEGNVQWVHKHINVMKWKHDVSYFITLCKAVMDYAEIAKEGKNVGGTKVSGVREDARRFEQ